jgi:hypothetical protein
MKERLQGILLYLNERYIRGLIYRRAYIGAYLRGLYPRLSIGGWGNIPF